MIITLLGSSGVGFVWGWLVAAVLDSIQRTTRNIVLLGLATLLVLIEAVWLAGWRYAVFLLGAASVALLVHIVHRRTLRRGINK